MNTGITMMLMVEELKGVKIKTFSMDKLKNLGGNDKDANSLNTFL